MLNISVCKNLKNVDILCIHYQTLSFLHKFMTENDVSHPFGIVKFLTCNFIDSEKCYHIIATSSVMFKPLEKEILREHVSK